MASLKTLANKTVTTSGTPEAITAVGTRAEKVIIEALSTNTNVVYVGDANVSFSGKRGVSLLATKTYVIDPSSDDQRDEGINMATIFVDPQTNGEGVSISYIEVSKGV